MRCSRSNPCSSTSQPGLLPRTCAPFRERIRRLVDTGDHSLEEMRPRIRLRSMAARFIPPRHFETVRQRHARAPAAALRHYNRGTDESNEREISPQRLVHYRDNWYLDAWCHLREGLRCSRSNRSAGQPAR